MQTDPHGDRPASAEPAIDLALLYELSLMAGRSLDFHDACSAFVETLMARCGFAFASIWIRRERLPGFCPGRGDGAERVLAFARPVARIAELRLPARHALVRRVDTERWFSVGHGTPGFAELVSESGIERGVFVVFRLREFGFLKLWADTRNRPLSVRWMERLGEVVDRFAVTVAGCLANAVREQLARRDRQLQQGALRANRLEGLGALAGGIAHDFNNLLTAMLGNTDLLRIALREAAAPDGVDELLDNVENAAGRAVEMCGQLLVSAGRQQGGDADEVAGINGVVDEMVRLTSAMRPRHAELVLQQGDEVPAVRCRPSELRQVVLNLLTNASQALPTGGGRLFVRTGSLPLHAKDLNACQVRDRARPGTFAFVEVEDTGTGMSDETVARVFETFFSTKESGQGLGLAAVRQIVVQRRGAVQVESRQGTGTRFRVLFPVVEFAAGLDEPDARRARGVVGSRVLVVEAHEARRRMLTETLGDVGCEVQAVARAEDAMDLVDGCDLLLIDFGTAGRDELRALEEVAASTPRTRVVRIDAVPRLERASGLDTAAYLAGEPTPDEVERVVRSLFGGV